MVTFTAAHRLDDPLSETLARIKIAKDRMQHGAAYCRLNACRAGMVSATEIMWSPINGWHPHFHEAWFFPFYPAPDVEELASRLFPMWQRACSKVGLETREFWEDRRTGRLKRVGVDVRPAWDVSEYLTKFDRERSWDLPSEMTAGRMKLGRGQSLTPWALLEEAIIRGSGSPAESLWIEYLRATKGYQCVSLRGARDLCKKFGLPTSYDDWVDANSAGDGEVIGTISAEAYDRVVRQGGLGRLLEAARAGGLPAIVKELGS